MSAQAEPFSPTPALETLHQGFLTILPRVQLHATIYFRHLKCPHEKQDAIAETVGIAWKWYRRLTEKGRDPARFLTAFARFAARAVKAGRRVGSQEKAKDVLSPVAQRRHGFDLEPLPTSTRRSFYNIQALVRGQQALDAYEERLQDNRVTPPPDAAAFRIDFPQFLATLSERDREMAMHLSLGHQGKHVARKFGVSPSRITQLRQRWRREWRRSQGEEPGEA